jgi:apolipoprotein N-acyltransferase
MLCGLVNTCCVLNHCHSISHLHAPIMSQNQSPNFCTSHKITGQCPFIFLLVTPTALLLACHRSHPYLYNTLIFSEVPLCWILDPEDGQVCFSRTSPGNCLLVNSVISQKTWIFNSTAVAASYLGRLSSFQFTFNPLPLSKTSETMRKLFVGLPQFDLTRVSSWVFVPCLSYKCQAYTMFDF